MFKRGIIEYTPAPPGYNIDILLVAGGGGSCATWSAGGGAGGMLYQTAYHIGLSTAYPIVIGAGGGNFAQGANSTFDILTAIGGGYGGPSGNRGGNGGSGGGAYPSLFPTPGTGISGQGHDGGTVTMDLYDPVAGYSNTLGSGGGGAGENGHPNSVLVGGLGGDGLANSISGTSVYYAGGGSSSKGQGNGLTGPSLGGGGKGAAWGSTNGTAGTINTGGGGGASNGAKAGGSGIVILRYLGAQRGTGGTITNDGTYTIHTFTTSGTYNS